MRLKLTKMHLSVQSKIEWQAFDALLITFDSESNQTLTFDS